MGTSYRPYNPKQTLLLPPNLAEWLKEDHLAHFINETVDELDVKGFYEEYEGDGRRNQPFEPRMMLKILLYGYSTGTFSSRKIAQKLEEDVAFRYLAANNFPRHRTISEFRRRHLSRFEELFVQVVQVAQKVGLVKLGTVAIDGTKVKANASKHKAMSYGRMKEEAHRIRKEIKEIEKEISKRTKQAEVVDDEEDKRYGKDNRGDELPEELRRRDDRLKRIREARKELEERKKAEHGGKPEDKDQINFTDSESRIMKTKDGFDQCYNVQAAVDAKTHIVVAAGVTQSSADTGSLIPMVDAVKKNTGRSPRQILADAGYRSEGNFRALAERELYALVSLGREGTPDPKLVDEDLKLTYKMRRRLKTRKGKELYKRRKAIAEVPFSWLKAGLGFRKFSVRSLVNVVGETFLAFLALNLRRLSSRIVWA